MSTDSNKLEGGNTFSGEQKWIEFLYIQTDLVTVHNQTAYPISIY